MTHLGPVMYRTGFLPCKKTKACLSQVEDNWTEFHEILKISLLKKTFNINILPKDCHTFL